MNERALANMLFRYAAVVARHDAAAFTRRLRSASALLKRGADARAALHSARA